MKEIQVIPERLDSETHALIKDIIDSLSNRHPDLMAIILFGSVARHEERSLDDPDTSDVDLLALFNNDDPHFVLFQGDSLSHSLGLAYNRHLDAPREVKVMFSSRNMQ